MDLTKTSLQWGPQTIFECTTKDILNEEYVNFANS